MQRITIGRYKHATPVVKPEMHDIDSETTREHTPQLVDVADIYDGWIEGTRDDGTTWIMWLDATGNPEVFWGQRDEDGGVEGEPVMLTTDTLDSEHEQ